MRLGSDGGEVTGLGSAACPGLAQDLNGQLEIFYQPGGGQHELQRAGSCTCMGSSYITIHANRMVLDTDVGFSLDHLHVSACFAWMGG